LPTRILLAISQGVRSYWWLILLALAALALALRRVLSDASARPAIDRIKLRAAFFGQIELKKEVSRLTRTLALLISGGIAIIQALELSSAVLANAVLKAEVAGCRERINKGESLSACLKQSPWFAGFCADIIAIGEETGTLEKSLLRVAEDYERDTEYSLTMFSKMIEPAVILVMGLVVGFIVISMLLPIFQVNLAAG
jgi:general secretion pathway protein F